MKSAVENSATRPFSDIVKQYREVAPERKLARNTNGCSMISQVSKIARPNGWRATGRRRALCVLKSVSPNPVGDVSALPLPKGEYGLPIVGKTTALMNDRIGFIKVGMEQNGKLFKANVLGSNAVFICDIDLINEIEKADPPVIKAGPIKSVVGILGENSLNCLNGPRHKFVRRMMFAALNSQAVDSYKSSISELSVKSLEEWASKDSVLFVSEMKKFAFDVVLDCVVGLSSEKYPADDLLPIFESMWVGFISLGINLPFTKFNESMRAREKIVKCILEQVGEVRNSEQTSDKRALCNLVNARDEYGNGLEVMEIVDNVITLLFAGYDTSASVACRCLKNLALHPQVMEKAAQEQQDLVDKYGSEISNAALDRMPYLDAVLNETMRLEPPAGTGFRTTVKTFEIDGYRIPQGWQVVYSYLGAMRNNGGGWEKPELFDPERHLEKGGTKGPCVPFGVGVHSCVGSLLAVVELKILFAHLLRDYNFDVQNPYAEMSNDAVAEPVDGMPVNFTKK